MMNSKTAWCMLCLFSFGLAASAASQISEEDAIAAIVEFVKDDMNPSVNNDNIATWDFSAIDPNTNMPVTNHDIERAEGERLRRAISIYLIDVDERDVPLGQGAFMVDLLVARNQPKATLGAGIKRKTGGKGAPASVDLSAAEPANRRIVIVGGGRGGDGSDSPSFGASGGDGGEGGSATIKGAATVTQSIFICLGGNGGHAGGSGESSAGANGGKAGLAQIIVTAPTSIGDTAFSCGGTGGSGSTGGVEFSIGRAGSSGGDGGEGANATVRIHSPTIGRAASGDGGRGCSGGGAAGENARAGNGGKGGPAGRSCNVTVDGDVAAANAVSVARASGGDGGTGGCGGGPVYSPSTFGGNGGQGGKGGDTMITTKAGFVDRSNMSMAGDGGDGGPASIGLSLPGQDGQGGVRGTPKSNSPGGRLVKGENGENGGALCGCP